LILKAKTQSTSARKVFGSGKTEFSKNTVEWIKTRRYLSDKKKSQNLTQEERIVICQLYNRANKIVKNFVKVEEQNRLEYFA
jgi:hypothetical protein